jgi:hypothetical protein
MNELASESMGTVFVSPERGGGDAMNELASESMGTVFDSSRRRSEAEVTR